MNLLGLFKKKQHGKFVEYDGKKYECILVWANSYDYTSVQLKEEPDSGRLKAFVDGNADGYPCNITSDFLRLLPEDGMLMGLTSKYFVSNIYDFLRMCKQGRGERVMVLKMKGSIFTLALNELNLKNVVKEIAVNVPEPTKGNQISTPSPAMGNGSNDGELKKKLTEWARTVFKNDKDMKEFERLNSTDMMIEALRNGIQQMMEEYSKRNSGSAQKLETPKPVESQAEALKADDCQKDDEIKKLNEAKAVQDDIIDEQTTKITDLNASVAEYKNKAIGLQRNISELNQMVSQLQANSYDLKTETIQSLDALKAELEKGNYIFDCNSLQPNNDLYLITHVDMLKQNIADGVKAAGLTEQRQELRNVLSRHLSDPDAVLNKLAMYYAYSRLPFMTEARSERGSFLNAARMSIIYNKVLAVLVPLGMMQIVPQLFVETVEEGAGSYENVTGQNDASVSLLTIMCPSLKQFTDKLYKREGVQVIKDIATIGYAVDGEIKEKTKILI